MEILKLTFLCKKYDNLRYVMFLLKKQDTSQKARQFILRFYMQKSRHFPLRNFHRKIEIGEREGGTRRTVTDRKSVTVRRETHVGP